MRPLYLLVVALVGLAGCSHVQSTGPELIETQPQLVQQCRMLGVIAETADADKIIQFRAAQEMVRNVRARAAQLGATHIVWLHKTGDSAAAQAYWCPADAPGEPSR